VHRAVGAVSRNDALIEARQRASALRLLDGRRRRRADAAEQLSPEVWDYMRSDPLNKDRRRKAYTAVAAKMACVVYAVVTSDIDYRRFPGATRPGGRIPSPRAVEASPTTS